ncbi:MAG TPA: tetratricopeptide repeat protein [Steroidobacteraceae bacterium]|nr:tetratricopeptide repeat protein [Steroidobacteraceae bacterium]
MFSFPISAKAFAALAMLACTACVSVTSRPGEAEPPQAFYTVTAEIALSRHEARVAALEYAAAAETTADVALLRRAAEVSAQCLQPTLTAGVAARWLDVDPAAMDAHRAAGKAALELHKIEQSAAHYRVVLKSSPRGTDGEFAVLETELSGAGNLFGARQLADLLAGYFPASPAALRMQAFAALRADDPAAAVRTFEAALAAAGGPPAASSADESSHAEESSHTEEEAARRELMQGLWRARILAGDPAEPLAQARDLLDRVDTVENRLDYALLLLAAQQTSAARAQLAMLTRDPGSGPLALRLLGLVDYQDGRLDEASARFAELVTTGKFLDDALYYLGMIAERHQDLERALRLYAEVQGGDNAVPALLRAATILKTHGAAPAADELLDHLVTEAPQRAPEILAARARIDAEAGDLTKAIAVLARAQAEYPDSVELRYAKASLSEEHGQVAAALHELKTVAALRPTDPAALNAYGYTLADNRRQLPVARRLIERAHAAAPRNASILDSLGWVLFRQGHSEEALPYLNAAYADDHDGDVAAHLGEVLWQLGRRSDAERIWSDANKAGSDNHLVNATRVRLHASN